MSQIYSQVTQTRKKSTKNVLTHWEGKQGGQEGTSQSGSGTTKPHLRTLPTTLAGQKQAAAAEQAEDTQRISSASTSHGAWFLPFFLGIHSLGLVILCSV